MSRLGDKYVVGTAIATLAVAAAGYFAHSRGLLSRYVSTSSTFTSSTTKRRIRAVLFDMDGTILESAEVWYRLLRDCVKHFGHPDLSYERWRQGFGQSMAMNVQLYMPGTSQKDADKYCEDNYAKHLNHMTVFPKSEFVCHSLASKTGGRICIVTNCPAPITMQTLAADKASGLLRVFGGGSTPNDPPGAEGLARAAFEGGLRAVCAGDLIAADILKGTNGETTENKSESVSSNSVTNPNVSPANASTSRPPSPFNVGGGANSGPPTVEIAPKPSSTMLEVAAMRLGVPLSECIMVGDSKFDILAGKNAGCYTIGIGVGGGDLQIDSIEGLLHLDEYVEFVRD